MFLTEVFVLAAFLTRKLRRAAKNLHIEIGAVFFDAHTLCSTLHDNASNLDFIDFCICKSGFTK